MAELADDPRFATSRARLANRDAIEAIVADRVRPLAGAELLARMTARGVPAGPVNTIAQVFADPVVAARGTVHRFVRDDGVEVPSVAFPGKLSATPARFESPPPRLGAHSRAILADWLGAAPDEIDRLAAAGAIG